jgi:hypothetical protein
VQAAARDQATGPDLVGALLARWNHVSELAGFPGTFSAATYPAWAHTVRA